MSLLTECLHQSISFFGKCLLIYDETPPESLEKSVNCFVSLIFFVLFSFSLFESDEVGGLDTVKGSIKIVPIHLRTLV